MTASDPFAALEGQQFMNLITFRKSGQPVATPVWFAREGNRLYVMTALDTGKVKRVRNSPRVELAPSDRRGTPLGPVFPARAQLLPEGAETRRADALLTQKYGWMKRMFDLMARVSGRGNQRAFLAIAPAEE
ncbi:MAG TPA: PPOX class F420-dependent oxidoreductase [Roseiflexaceae bacterium]|nr:PPOX class F420-dependent oxidoreductase [Roseiflexaceae bacterium]